MTIESLQDDLNAVIGEVLKDQLLKVYDFDADTDGRDGLRGKKPLPMRPYTGYVQSLPAREQDYEDYFPYYVVCLDEFETMPDDKLGEVTQASVRINFGVFDRDINMQGYRDLLCSMHRLWTYFLTYPYLFRKYTILRNIKMKIDEAAFPFFYAYMEIKVRLATPQVEDMYDFCTNVRTDSGRKEA